MQSLYTALTFLGFMGCIWSEASVILCCPLNFITQSIKNRFHEFCS